MEVSAYNYAVRLLARQDYSRAKLRQKLILREFASSEIEEALTKVVEKGYLREENYIKNKILSMVARNYSRSYIQRKLVQEGLKVDWEQMAPLLETEATPSEDDQIDKLIQKKWRSLSQRQLPTTKIREKILSFLFSKGHSFDKGKKILDKFLAAQDRIS
ncbi:MAG: regulatory protein RecX [Pseudomonadota bacterium]